jgi:hypothetical protein
MVLVILSSVDVFYDVCLLVGKDKNTAVSTLIKSPFGFFLVCIFGDVLEMFGELVSKQFEF